MLKAETILLGGISSGRPMSLKALDPSPETAAEPTSQETAGENVPFPNAAVKPPPSQDMKPLPSQLVFPNASFHQRRRTVDGSETSFFPSHQPLLSSPPLAKGHVAADGGLPGWRSPCDGAGSDGSSGSPVGGSSYETASDKGPSRAFPASADHEGLRVSAKRGVGPFKRQGWQERAASSRDSLDSPPANGSSRAPEALLAPWSRLLNSSPSGRTRPPACASPSSLLRPKPPSETTQAPHCRGLAPSSTDSPQAKAPDSQPPQSRDPTLRPHSSSWRPADNDAHRRSSFQLPAHDSHNDAHRRFDRSRRWSMDGSNEASLRIEEHEGPTRDFRSPPAPRCVFGWAAQTRLGQRLTPQGSPQDSPLSSRGSAKSQSHGGSSPKGPSEL